MTSSISFTFHSPLQSLSRLCPYSTSLTVVEGITTLSSIHRALLTGSSREREGCRPICCLSLLDSRGGWPCSGTTPRCIPAGLASVKLRGRCLRLIAEVVEVFPVALIVVVTVTTGLGGGRFFNGERLALTLSSFGQSGIASLAGGAGTEGAQVFPFD
jgi:hypothetical protein